MPTFKSKSVGLHLIALTALTALAASPGAQAQHGSRDNPSCPVTLNVSTWREMRLTPQTVDGRRILLAEGSIDEGLIPRLEAALSDDSFDEIWLRSPGGDAQISQYAGLLIRRAGLRSRIPADWACVGTCNFMFFGGAERVVDEGGVFIVRMFTTVEDHQAVRDEMARSGERASEVLDEIAQQSRRVATDDINFFIRMGVSRRLLSDIVYRQSALPQGSNRCLTRQEMREYRVVTD